MFTKTKIYKKQYSQEFEKRIDETYDTINCLNRGTLFATERSESYILPHSRTWTTVRQYNYTF